MNERLELFREFILESRENLDAVERQLVALEADPGNTNVINNIFRAVHSIKGASGFLELRQLESITHVGENLLDSLRAGRIALDAEITTSLLRLLDAARNILTQLEQFGSEGEQDLTSLTLQLERLNDRAQQAPGSPQTEASEKRESAPLDADPSQLGVAPVSVSNRVPHPETPIAPTASTPTPLASERRETPVGNSSPSVEEGKGLTVTDSSLRVDVALLDELMNLVGELVLARNQILQFTKTQSDSEFVSTSQRLNLITSELQEGVMRTRMQPIANVWNKFPRVVRDVARACGKEVRIEMQGKETDLDKTIIEAIKDPLTHIVRNSIDHGIEPPEVREASGKNREGRLLLRACHEGGYVIIEISDDGAGLNTERIRRKAVEQGLVKREIAETLSESEIHRLIFAPGFSTAETVTNISGRGVGMDVVRANIEKIGGTVDVHSIPREGTTVKIKIPLTLAIVPALIVSSSSHRFLIPQVNLLELVRIDPARRFSEIETVDGASFYRLRGNLLPLVSLRDVLKLPSDEGADERATNIVVVKADDRRFGLVVDRVHDTEEIVVKPLAKQLKEIEVFAGATIMGDGRVSLILDVPGLARVARIGTPARLAEGGARELTAVESASKQSLLVVQVGHSGRMAIPLQMVHRLEEFPLAAIELASGERVVQYRGGILPLIDLSTFFGFPGRERSTVSCVVVYLQGYRSIGLIVDQVLDIVEDHVVLDHEARRHGLLGSAVIQKKVTDLIDVEAVFRKLFPSDGEPTQRAIEEAHGASV